MSRKLVLFGDSLFGKVNKTKSLMLEKALDQEFDVYNCATGGWNTNDLLKKAPFIATLDADLFIVSVGTNDGSPWKQVNINDFERNLGPILDEFSNSNVILFPPPPVHEESRPKDKQIPNETMKAYYDAAVRVCVKGGIPYIHSWEIFMELQNRTQSYHVEDGVHLSEYGYEVLFGEISKVIKQ